MAAIPAKVAAAEVAAAATKPVIELDDSTEEDTSASAANVAPEATAVVVVVAAASTKAKTVLEFVISSIRSIRHLDTNRIPRFIIIIRRPQSKLQFLVKNEDG
jgi:hypothetical protein